MKYFSILALTIGFNAFAANPSSQILCSCSRNADTIQEELNQKIANAETSGYSKVSGASVAANAVGQAIVCVTVSK